jgi:hypothetical protein
MPHFQGLNVNREASIEWVKEHHAAGSWQRSDQQRLPRLAARRVAMHRAGR